LCVSRNIASASVCRLKSVNIRQSNKEELLSVYPARFVTVVMLPCHCAVLISCQRSLHIRLRRLRALNMCTVVSGMSRGRSHLCTQHGRPTDKIRPRGGDAQLCGDQYRSALYWLSHPFSCLLYLIVCVAALGESEYPYAGVAANEHPAIAVLREI